MDAIKYFINGENFKKFGIYVSASHGILDLPKLRKPDTTVWPDYHGEVVDLKAKYYEPRKITLSCFLGASNEVDFTTKVLAFREQFSKPGTARLQINVIPNKPLVFEVYNNEELRVTKVWEDSRMTGTFTLRLVEPEPLKKVLKVQGTSASLTITSQKMLTIRWGDGKTTNDLSGTNRSITHTYASSGTYYIIVAGCIEEIEALTTTAETVWERL